MTRLRRVELPPAVASERPATMVLLHGFGADENDLVSLARELDPTLRALSLAAPLKLPWGGRAWYHLEQTPQGFSVDPGEVRAAHDTVVAELDAIGQELGARPWVCGFSQGAGLAVSAALARPELVRGVLSFSAAPPRLADPPRAPPGALKSLRVFAAHGTQDPLLPIGLGRATKATLALAGVDLTWREYPMAHQIVLEELEDARAWMAAAAKDS